MRIRAVRGPAGNDDVEVVGSSVDGSWSCRDSAPGENGLHVHAQHGADIVIGKPGIGEHVDRAGGDNFLARLEDCDERHGCPNGFNGANRGDQGRGVRVVSAQVATPARSEAQG